MMRLPSKQQCFALWEKYQMPENIRQHSLQVAKVADVVARYIGRQVRKLNFALINRGALLHDLAKILSVNGQTKLGHGQLGAQLILQEGYSKALANVIRAHMLGAFSWRLTLEEQVVGYADRRVNHDQIVNLEKRMKYLKERYPASRAIIAKKLPFFYEFEDKYNLSQLAFNH